MKILEGTNKTALITGASAGIGKALAEVFASNGFNIVLVARRLDKLQEVAAGIEKRHAVTTTCLVADLARANASQKLYDEVAAANIRIDVLVNNAGYAINESFMDASWKAHQDFLNVMLLSVTQLCYLFAKDMKTRGYGRIINVSSVAAFAPQWGGSLYGAVKSYVKHFSEALDLELKPQNVYCMALCPGFTFSEFHDVMGTRGAVSKLPKWMWMDARTVAEQAYKAVMRGEVTCITGVVNRTMVTAFELMPRKVKYLISEKQNFL
jgi:short-subunit dehydrogenase